MDGSPLLAAPRIPVERSGTGIFGFYLAALFLVPTRYAFGPYEPLTASVSVALVLALLWGASKMTPSDVMTRGHQGIVTMVLLFLGLATISYVVTNAGPIDPKQAEDSLRNLLLLFAMCAVALAVADGLRTRAQLERVIALAVGLAGVVGAMAIIQFVTGVDVPRWLKPPGFVAARGDEFILSRGGLPRVMGTARHPIEFAVVAAAMVPLGIYVATRGRTRGVRQMATASTAVLVLALPMAFSRTGLAALAVVAAFMLAFLPLRITMRLAVAAILLALLAMLATPQVFQGVDDLLDGRVGTGSVQGRAAAREKAWEIARDARWFGYGFGTENPEVRGFLIDNTYFVALLETGWVGVSALGGLLTVGIVSGLGVRSRGRGRSRDPATRELGAMLAAAVAAIAVAGWGLPILRFGMVAGLLFFVFGCIAALRRQLDAVDATAAPVAVPPIRVPHARPSRLAL